MAKRSHVTTTINGDEYEFLCEPDQSLVDVLRNELELTGTKEGCSTGDCGACSISLEGALVLCRVVKSPRVGSSAAVRDSKECNLSYKLETA